MRLALPEGFKLLKLPPASIRTTTPEQLSLFQRTQLEELPPDDLIADNHPSNIYATLERNGQTIATLYKSGGIMTPDAVGLPSDLSNEGGGLPLAEKRLQQMLELHGGTVSYSRQNAAAPSSANATTLFAAQLARDR